MEFKERPRHVSMLDRWAQDDDPFGFIVQESDEVNPKGKSAEPGMQPKAKDNKKV